MRHDDQVRVAIVGGDNGLVRSLAAKLDRRDATTATITATSATAIQLGLESAQQSLGETPTVVRIGLDPQQQIASPLVATSSESWTARAERPLKVAFGFHQAATRFLGDRGGRIVVVLPATGLSGAPGAVPLSTACEGERSLLKAQARVVGAQNITVNCIAVAPELLRASTELERGGLPPRALPTPDLEQLADLIVAMSGLGFAGVTGQTIALDGGRWMAP
jgi:NAD(P)-dependent dehydrogenase (short-subunit alcohol dehydrogenase family)